MDGRRGFLSGSGTREPHRGAHRLQRRFRASDGHRAADLGGRGSARRSRCSPRTPASFDRVALFDLDRPGPTRRGDFIDYLEGTARVLEDSGLRLPGQTS